MTVLRRAHAESRHSSMGIDAAALARLRQEALPIGTKGLPLGYAGGTSLDDIAAAGWNVLAGDLPLPLLILNGPAVKHNVETMAAYCREHGVLLAPHGKTTMAPQLFALQQEAGCWALTAATPGHLSLYRSFGITRILYANELVEPVALQWVANELNGDPAFEFYCLVDSRQGVERMASILSSAGVQRPLNVLIEVGHSKGRAGCRTIDDVLVVAATIARTRHLRLVGVETFEGLLQRDEAIVDLLATVESSLDTLLKRQLVSRDVIVSAGGSAYFDLVVERMALLAQRLPGLRLVLRSGCYIAHDGGFYDEISPLGARAGRGSLKLEAALEVWSTVVSRPEPDFVVAGAGKRDLPIDMGYPTVTRSWSSTDGFRELSDASVSVIDVSDQHLHLTVGPGVPLGVGDLLAWTISHPCTAFDKWRLIPVVDHDLNVIDGIRTFF